MNKEMSTKYRDERSLNGYSLDVLKSALQKYIRRGFANKAIYAGLELDFFDCLEGGGRIYTNLIHRLMIIYLEDVGLSGFLIWKDLDTIFQKLLKKEKSGEKTYPKGDRTRGVIDIINTLSRNMHSRVGSHFNSIYNNRGNNELKPYLDYFPKVKEIYDEIDKHARGVDLDDKKELEELYYISLKNQWKDSFYWAKRIDDSELFKPAEKRRILFGTFRKVLEELGKRDPENIIDVAEKWYEELNTLKERFLTYYLPIIVWTFEKKIDGKMYPIKPWKGYVFRNVMEKPLVFDEYIYDMHTKEGKRMGKCEQEFIKEGSQVRNEYVFFEELKRFYEFSKLLLKCGKVDKEMLFTVVEKNDPLSIWSKWSFRIDNKTWRSVQHYFQAMKDKRDKKYLQEVIDSKDADEAISIAKKYDKAYETIEDADKYLKEGIFANLSQNRELEEILKKTKGKIRFYYDDQYLGVDGMNRVGEYLMEYRDEEEIDEIEEFSEEEIGTDKESEAFDFIVRAQLVTSAYKTDTYYAKDKKTGKIVFVKGPFKSEKDITALETNQKVRQILGLDYVNSKRIDLIPDLLKSPLSIRNSLEKGKKYPFVVFQNLCEEDFKIKMMSSKLWSETPVVDWSKMQKCGIFHPPEGSEKEIKQYVIHLLFRKMMGVGDLADRNFMLVNDKVYSVDEDVIGKEEWKVSDDIKKKRWEIVQGEIKKNRKFYENLLKDWGDKLAKDGIVKKYPFILKNLSSIDLRDF